MEDLKEILENNLRKEDLYVEYANNRMMVLLPDMREESLNKISERIKRRFEGSRYSEEFLIDAQYNFLPESRENVR